MFDKSRWLKIADELKPMLFTETVRPGCSFPSSALTRGDSLVLDFGNHFVGRISMRLHSVGSHQDAPAFLSIKFCEVDKELHEDATAYSGWISRGWIQEEQLHIDVLPDTVSLPRRYAFRYVKITVIDVSSKYRLVVDDVWAECTTSADDSQLKPLVCSQEDGRLDAIALRTLRNCMQDVFEDGPKRDRRLWLGDLRLQALANYATYRHINLVKRCLYLFAGTTGEDDRIAACLFTTPENQTDDTYMMDYTLFFIPTLLDYYEATGDIETLRDLAPLALKQLDITASYFDERQVVRDSHELGWCFVDWNLDLNKQASAQAIYIYCAKAAEQIAITLRWTEVAHKIRQDWQAKAQAAMVHLYDRKKGLFISGERAQVSVASQVWFVLSGILSAKQCQQALKRVDSFPGAEKMVTPYMYHHYVHALYKANMSDTARMAMKRYWGGMVEQGACTFFELFNPENPDESPYGSSIVNSYCHAWSCTPTWFLRTEQARLDTKVIVAKSHVTAMA